MKLNRLFLTQLVLCFCVFAGTFFAQTTEFTYQGRLLDNSLPPTANYDFEFSLWDSLVAGTQQGTTQTVTGVAVANGIFTVRLNFGAQFSGPPRFMQIAMRPAGGGAYTTLAPRQPITSGPYAIRSFNSTSADTATNSLNLGGVAANQYVVTTDPRMTDARSPLPGSGNYIQNQTSGAQTAGFNIAGSSGIPIASVTNGSTGGNAFAIQGSISSANPGGNSTAIRGINNGAGVNGIGVWGSHAGSGYGVFGTVGPGGFAIRGEATSGGIGLFGSAPTTGSNYAVFASGNSRVTNDHSVGGRIGVGTMTPDAPVHVITETDSTGLFVSYLGDSDGLTQPNFTGRKSRGTFTAPTAVLTGDALVGLTGRGFNGSAFTSSRGSVGVVATEPWTTTANGTQMSFFTTANGTTAPNLRMTIDHDGQVGIGTTTPAELLHVNGTGIVRARVNSDTNSGFQLSLGGAIRWSLATVTGNSFLLFNETTATTALSVDSATNAVTISSLGAAGATALCRNASNEISTCSSSLRYKANIGGFNGGMSFVNKLRPISFDWKDGGMKDVGFGAEDIAKIDSRFVTFNSKGEVEGVKYDRLSVAFVNAFKEQQTEISELRAATSEQAEKIKVQNSRIDDQQKQLDALKKLICAQNPTADVCKEEK